VFEAVLGGLGGGWGRAVVGWRESVIGREMPMVCLGLCINFVLDRGGTSRGDGRIFLSEVRIARHRRGFGLPIGVWLLFSMGSGSGEMCHR
jgi:hypothetical protein